METERAREERRDSRLSHFAEANVYSAYAIKETGIFNYLYQNLIMNFMKVMESYHDYFITDDRYLHALGRALYGMRISNQIIQFIEETGPMAFRTDAEEAAEEIQKIVIEAIEMARERWATFNDQYFAFKFRLRELGVLT